MFDKSIKQYQSNNTILCCNITERNPGSTKKIMKIAKKEKEKREKFFILLSLFSLFSSFLLYFPADFHFLIQAHFLFTLRKANTPNPASNTEKALNPGNDNLFSSEAESTGRAVYVS